MTTYFRLFLLAFFAGLSFTTIAQEIKVATSDIAPFSYYENNELSGYHIDIFKQLEIYSGLKFNYRVLPYARMKLFVESEKPDLMVSFRGTCSKFSNEYEVQTKLYEVNPTIYVRESSVYLKENIRIGRIIETCNKLLDGQFRKDQIFNLNSMAQAIEMLRTHRIEGVCGLGPVVNFYADKNKNFKEKLIVYKKTQSNEVGFFDAVLCRKKGLSPDIKKKLETAALRLKIPVIK